MGSLPVFLFGGRMTNGVVVQQTVVINVSFSAGITPLSFPNPLVPTPGIVGKPYTLNLAQYATGGAPPYTFTPVTTLPTGWALTSAGVLTIAAYPAAAILIQIGSVTDTGGQ